MESRISLDDLETVDASGARITVGDVIFSSCRFLVRSFENTYRLYNDVPHWKNHTYYRALNEDEPMVYLGYSSDYTLSAVYVFSIGAVCYVCPSRVKLFSKLYY